MMRNTQIHGFWYLLIVSGVFTADRLTKNWALEHCLEPCTVTDYLSFQVIFNRGISWGFLSSESSLIFSFVSFLIAGIVIGLGLYTFVRWNNTHWVIGELLVLSGAISNLADRVLYGGVIDFILLSAKGYCWPYFNVADMCIVFGVGLMMIALLWES